MSFQIDTCFSLSSNVTLHLGVLDGFFDAQASRLLSLAFRGQGHPRSRSQILLLALLDLTKQHLIEINVHVDTRYTSWPVDNVYCAKPSR